MKYYVLGAVLAVTGCSGTPETATKGAEPAAAAASPSIPDGSAVIGEELTAESAIPLATIRTDPERYFERTLLVEATAAAVCQAKGCWLTLSDGSSTSDPIWVRWSSGCGGAYAFPQDIVGKKVWVQGSLYAKTISEEDAEHLAQESALLEADDIAGDAFEMNATACVILPGESVVAQEL
jgi:hypothetical protein